MTGDAFIELTLIFPSTFDGKVGLFQGEVNLKMTPETKSVQMPPCTVPLSVMPKLEVELDRIKKRLSFDPAQKPQIECTHIVIAS